MRLHFWYVNLRNERGVLSFSRTVCVHVCSSLTLWEEFLHRVYSGATYAFRKAFCCDWMWYRNNPDGHRGGVNTFYSLCIFEGTSCIGGIVGVRLSVKCKQIPRTSDPCSGPTGLASENVERSRLGHSLEKMWFSFGRSGSCGMQDAGNISFWKISCWHFWVWDMQRGSQARAKTKDIKCTWSLIRANWQTTVSSTRSCSEAKSCLAAFYSGECQRHSEGFILTLISTVCHKLWFYNKLQAFGVGEHHTLGLHQLQTNRPKDGTAPTVSKYISVFPKSSLRSPSHHIIGPVIISLVLSLQDPSDHLQKFTPSKSDEAPTVVKVWMVPPLHGLSDSARSFPVFGTADIHVKFSGLKFTVWIWLKIQPKEFHTAPSVTVWGQDLLLFSTTFSVTSCIAGHV